MLSDKKLASIQKSLGADVLEELNGCAVIDLDSAIALAAGAIKEAEDQLEANPQYQELKASLKACSEGLREVKKFQNAKIQYSLHLLEEKGKQ